MSEVDRKERTPVEETVVGHMKEIMKANELKDLDETYEFVVDRWYQYDALWLNVVMAMKKTGRLH